MKVSGSGSIASEGAARREREEPIFGGLSGRREEGGGEVLLITSSNIYRGGGKKIMRFLQGENRAGEKRCQGVSLKSGVDQHFPYVSGRKPFFHSPLGIVELNERGEGRSVFFRRRKEAPSPFPRRGPQGCEKFSVCGCAKWLSISFSLRKVQKDHLSASNRAVGFAILGAAGQPLGQIGVFLLCFFSFPLSNLWLKLKSPPLEGTGHATMGGGMEEGEECVLPQYL